MWKLHITLDALKDVQEVVYHKTFLGKSKKEVVEKSCAFIQLLHKGGWQIVHMDTDFINLSS